MVTAKVKVINPLGLHMRPAHVFVGGVKPFESEVTLVRGGNTTNAKSILQVMLANIHQGDEIEIRCSGPDEAEALAKAVALIESGLGE